MIIKKLNIKNFRNYENATINFNPKINIIYGNNGEGKTNLLESIYVLSMTKSHLSCLDSVLIKKDKEFSIINGEIEKDNIMSKYEVFINKDKKTLKIDLNEIKKIGEYISNINIIFFYPDDLQLIKGSPIDRRTYINMEIGQINNKYVEILNRYNKILQTRNLYLKNENNFNQIYFETITDHLIEYAILLMKLRKKYIEKINQYCGKIFYEMTGIENFKVIYLPNIKENNEIEELKKIYKNIYEKEKKFKITLLGPHKDDIEFYINDKNLKTYGSQGQQRMAVLAFKLSELSIIKDIKKENPILLLDDVFSELDIEKKNKLLKFIGNNIQVIITTTDLENIDSKILKKAKKIKIENGKIIRRGGKNGK